MAGQVGPRTLSGFFREAIEAIHVSLTAIPLWLSFNLTFFDTFKAIPTGFTWWADHAPQIVWARYLFVLFLCGMVGLIFKNRWLRLASATVLGVGHAIIATGFYLSNPAATGTGVYFILAILAVWRIMLEA
jgi:hypothetical protein